MHKNSALNIRSYKIFGTSLIRCWNFLYAELDDMFDPFLLLTDGVIMHEVIIIYLIKKKLVVDSQHLLNGTNLPHMNGTSILI